MCVESTYRNSCTLRNSPSTTSRALSDSYTECFSTPIVEEEVILTNSTYDLRALPTIGHDVGPAVLCRAVGTATDESDNGHSTAVFN